MDLALFARPDRHRTGFGLSACVHAGHDDAGPDAAFVSESGYDHELVHASGQRKTDAGVDAVAAADSGALFDVRHLPGRVPLILPGCSLTLAMKLRIPITLLFVAFPAWAQCS